VAAFLVVKLMARDYLPDLGPIPPKSLVSYFQHNARVVSHGNPVKVKVKVKVFLCKP